MFSRRDYVRWISNSPAKVPNDVYLALGDTENLDSLSDKEFGMIAHVSRLIDNSMRESMDEVISEFRTHKNDPRTVDLVFDFAQHCAEPLPEDVLEYIGSIIRF